MKRSDLSLGALLTLDAYGVRVEDMNIRAVDLETGREYVTDGVMRGNQFLAIHADGQGWSLITWYTTKLSELEK
jgi:hypothetical protein